MPSWLPQMTAIALALHTLLGCCWHHAHADEAGVTVACEDHNHDEHSPADHDHSFDCNESGCAFVKGNQTLDDLPSISAGLVAILFDGAGTRGASEAVGPAILLGFPAVNNLHFLCAVLRC